MAIKELFYDNRPHVLLDPRASKRIDPRFKFTRDSIGTYVDANGIIQTTRANEARFDHDVNGQCLGLLIEESRTNNVFYSDKLNGGRWVSPYSLTRGTVHYDAAVAPDGTSTATELRCTSDAGNTDFSYYGHTEGSTGEAWTFSVFVKPNGVETVQLYYDQAYGQGVGTFTLTGNGTATPINNASAARITKLSNGWYRCEATTLSKTYTRGDHAIRFTSPANNTSGVYLWGAQAELGGFASSYIPTTSIAVTRSPDLLSVRTNLPETGSIYIDAQAFRAKENDTLLSLKNSSNQKVNLSYVSNDATFNSLALIGSYQGNSKTTLPLPVPTTNRERNIITYGSNNYQYGQTSSRYAASLASSVPSNLNQLSIGHDAVDESLAFSGYINSVYAWSGELTPTVTEALVRGTVDPKNADAGSFTPRANSLAFVFNTQGTAVDGDTQVEIPFLGSTNNVEVYWGDNTSSSFIGAAASGNVTHNYSAAGIYPVEVLGDDDGTNSGLSGLIFNSSTQKTDLLRILQFGGTATWQPTSMNNVFAGCTQLQFGSTAYTTSDLPDTSGITGWYRAFQSCSSIGPTFPAFDTSSATTLQSTWQFNSGLTSFPPISTSNVTNMQQAWQHCSNLENFPSIDTSKVTNLAYTWYNCSLTSFPTPNDELMDFSKVRDFTGAWYNNKFTSFPTINTSSALNLSQAWSNTSLTEFPFLVTSNVTNMQQAWMRCRALQKFPLIDTSNVTNLSLAWYECEALDNINNGGQATSFPQINTSSCTNFSNAWFECFALTVFPPLDTSSGETFSGAWRSCTGLTSFPAINISSATSMGEAWRACNSLTSFPSPSGNLLDFSSVTSLYYTWESCTSLQSFPLIDTSSCTNISFAWANCFVLDNIANASGTYSFPQIDTSNVTNFAAAWYRNNALVSFPPLNFNNGASFGSCWFQCTDMTTFPPNLFDNWNPTTVNNQCFFQTWAGCSSLTATSVNNILVSIDTSGVSAPSGTGTHDKWIVINYDGTTLQGTTTSAINNLKSRNWVIVLQGAIQ